MTDGTSMANEGGAPVTVLTVSYDGAAFHGFARQDGLETVQGRLEAALTTVLARPVEVVGAGRTDAGVHALGQVVSFASAPGDAAPAAIARSVTALAGPAVAVTGVRTEAPGFSARHSAIAREYRYRIVARDVPPVMLAGRAWWVKAPLDLAAMRAGAAHLLGEHDFRSFCVTESAEGKRTVRDISTLEVLEGVEMGEPVVTIRVVGRSFLHSMVRIIVGTLVEVGKGRREPGWVADALVACDRGAAGPTAPPEGLTLWEVRYAGPC